MNIQSIIAEIKSQPEVLKSEAFAAGAKIVELAEAGDADSLAKMFEIVGFVTQCDDVEYWRRFVVWQLEHGPIAK